MTDAKYPIAVVVAAVQRLERGADLEGLSREMECSSAQLLVWLGKYGTGRIARRVRNAEGRYEKRVSFVSESSYHVAANASPGVHDCELLKRLAPDTLPVSAGRIE